MSSDDAHCEALVRDEDCGRYLATLFAPAQHRAALCALHAFHIETAQVPFRVREPLAGEIRLQWWRDVIEGPARDQAAGNPVAAALLAARDRYELPQAPLLALVDARRRELETLPFDTVSMFRRYARETDGAVLQLAGQILLGGRDEVPDALLAHAGEASATMRLIGTFARFRLQGKIVIPVDILVAHGLPPADLLDAGEHPNLGAALADFARRGLESLEKTRALLPDCPQAAGPAFLPLALVRPALVAAASPSFEPAAPPILPQWRQQWRLWRASRNLVAHI